MAYKDDTFYINILLEETENEVFGGESSDEEIDNVEENDHNSETEQSADSDVHQADVDENVDEDMDVSVETPGNNYTLNNVNQCSVNDHSDENYTIQCRSELNLDEYNSDEDDLPYSERVTCFYGKPKKGRVIEPPTKWYRKRPAFAKSIWLKYVETVLT